MFWHLSVCPHGDTPVMSQFQTGVPHSSQSGYSILLDESTHPSQLGATHPSQWGYTILPNGVPYPSWWGFLMEVPQGTNPPLGLNGRIWSGLDGVLSLQSGLDGVPPVRTGWGTPPPLRRQSSRASTCNTAGGMRLAFTQEDFLFFDFVPWHGHFYWQNVTEIPALEWRKVLVNSSPNWIKNRGGVICKNVKSVPLRFISLPLGLSFLQLEFAYKANVTFCGHVHSGFERRCPLLSLAQTTPYHFSKLS